MKKNEISLRRHPKFHFGRNVNGDLIRLPDSAGEERILSRAADPAANVVGQNTMNDEERKMQAKKIRLMKSTQLMLLVWGGAVIWFLAVIAYGK